MYNFIFSIPRKVRSDTADQCQPALAIQEFNERRSPTFVAFVLLLCSHLKTRGSERSLAPTHSTMTKKFLLLLLLAVDYMPSAGSFAGPVRTTSLVARRMAKTCDDGATSKGAETAVRGHPASSPLMNASRRETLTGTAALFTLPFLKELLVSSEVRLLPTSGVSEALAQGDVIVRNLWLSRLTYPVLIVALETGVFEALKRKALSKHDLGRRMIPAVQCDGRVLEAIVAVLTTLKLLKLHDKTVSLTDAARYVLLRDSPYFWGPQLLASDGITSALRRAVYTEGRPAKDYAGHSIASIDSFIDSMQAHGAVTALVSADALETVIGKSAAVPAKHVLDMAGGSGCFAAALSANGVTVTLADLPTVVARWRRQHPFAKVDAMPADLFAADTWPIGPDCHLMANVLHDWGESQVLAILQASRTALAKSAAVNGRLIVIEQLLTNDRSGPLPAALASVSMLLGDWRTGKQYSFAELQAMAQAAGFARVELGPKCGAFYTAVVAHV